MCSRGRWRFASPIGPPSWRRAASGRLPKGLPHAIRNPLERSSRYLFLAVPGGIDRWFDAVAEANAKGSLDDGLYRRLSDEFGLGWLE